MSINSIGNWKDNAELIADVAKLGFVAGDVLDLSYGNGTFWKHYKPPYLTTNDINPDKGDHSYSVYDTPPREWVMRFDTVVWDPPYKLSGTPALGDFDERYGINTEMSVANKLELIRIGTVRAFECVLPGGYVLIKCQDQVVSGALYEQSEDIKQIAKAMGAKLLDRAHLTYTPRPQPKGRRQLHLRNNFSTLLIFK